MLGSGHAEPLYCFWSLLRAGIGPFEGLSMTWFTERAEYLQGLDRCLQPRCPYRRVYSEFCKPGEGIRAPIWQ